MYANRTKADETTLDLNCYYSGGGSNRNRDEPTGYLNEAYLMDCSSTGVETHVSGMMMHVPNMRYADHFVYDEHDQYEALR